MLVYEEKSRERGRELSLNSGLIAATAADATVCRAPFLTDGRTDRESSTWPRDLLWPREIPYANDAAENIPRVLIDGYVMCVNVGLEELVYNNNINNDNKSD